MKSYARNKFLEGVSRPNRDIDHGRMPDYQSDYSEYTVECCESAQEQTQDEFGADAWEDIEEDAPLHMETWSGASRVRQSLQYEETMRVLTLIDPGMEPHISNNEKIFFSLRSDLIGRPFGARSLISYEEALEIIRVYYELQAVYNHSRVNPVVRRDIEIATSGDVGPWEGELENCPDLAESSPPPVYLEDSDFKSDSSIIDELSNEVVQSPGETPSVTYIRLGYRSITNMLHDYRHRNGNRNKSTLIPNDCVAVNSSLVRGILLGTSNFPPVNGVLLGFHDPIRPQTIADACGMLAFRSLSHDGLSWWRYHQRPEELCTLPYKRFKCPFVKPGKKPPDDLLLFKL